MPIKINEKILSIPPYISTTWSQISALRMRGNLLLVTLSDGETISISHLDQEQVNLIFSFHALFLEKEILPLSQSQHPSNLMMKTPFNPLTESTTLSFAFGSMEGFNSVVQHNPSQADAPDLPLEVLNKIAEIAKVVFCLDEELQSPKAEPNCNCFHCQIARVVNPAHQSDFKSNEPELHFSAEEVLDDELKFEQWSIIQVGDQLYHVLNRLDEQEKYHVFLGEPVGCTCGKENCEHIVAVLKS